MKKISKIFQGILVILMITNIFVTPKTIYNLIDVSKSLYSFNEYELKKVKIDTILSLDYSHGDGSSYTSHRVLYAGKQKKISLLGNGNVLKIYDRYRKESKHFNEIILKDYRNKYRIDSNGNYELNKRNDSIWVWENYYATNHYAMGKNDVFSKSLLIKRIIVNLTFILIAIYSLFWIKRNLKFK